MKKNVLALSITAAVVGFGLAGGAQAMTGALGGATAGSDLMLNGDGIGHMLLVPYFSAQDNNATLINLVNTDTVNGKAVKVRFRGAANSDDVFDFQVFLSPGDVYAFNISQNSAGLGQISTVDNSCTKPSKAVLNATPFVTSRLDSALDAGGKANGTREGYIEIFNMGDIPKTGVVATKIEDLVGATDAGLVAAAGTNPLYTAIKHVSGVAPCSGTAWTNLDTNNMAWNATSPGTGNTPRARGMLPPTSGLMGNWIIINTVNAAAWGRGAVAIRAETAGVPVTGNVVYWPQTGTEVGVAAIDAFTADPLMRAANVSRWNASTLLYAADTIPAVTAAFYDLPDMSTPYVDLAAGNPLAQATHLTDAIAATSATNEFLTDPTILATTDWVFSQPTRRYNISLDYAAIAAGDDGRRFTDLMADGLATGYYLQQNTLVTSRQICVKGITTSVWDREEANLAATTDVVVSPSTPADPLSFCGEASVLSINNGGITAAGSGSLKAQVSVKDLDVTYVNGWMTLTTPSATAVAGADGLPVMGSSFYRANAGPQSFGAAMEHRFTR